MSTRQVRNFEGNLAAFFIVHTDVDRLSGVLENEIRRRSDGQ